MVELFEVFWSWWYMVAIAIGAMAWFIRGIAWWAWLVIITSLLFFWVPLESAVFANKVWQVGYGIWALPQYLKTNLVRRKYVIPLTVIGVFWWWIWAEILVNLDKDVIIPIIAIILLLLVPALIFRKNTWVNWFSPTKWQMLLWYLLMCFVYIYGWAFGGWMWVMTVYVWLFLFWFTILQRKATSIIPSVFMNLAAITSFYFLWITSWAIWVLVFLWMIIWWRIWSKIAISKWNPWLKYLLVFFILISTWKLLYPYLS